MTWELLVVLLLVRLFVLVVHRLGRRRRVFVAASGSAPVLTNAWREPSRGRRGPRSTPRPACCADGGWQTAHPLEGGRSRPGSATVDGSTCLEGCDNDLGADVSRARTGLHRGSTYASPAPALHWVRLHARPDDVRVQEAREEEESCAGRGDRSTAVKALFGWVRARSRPDASQRPRILPEAIRRPGCRHSNKVSNPFSSGFRRRKR